MKKNILKLFAVTSIFIIAAIVLSSGSLKSSGGGYNDLVDDLYKQEVNKNASLEKIETAIKNYNNKNEEAIEAYNKYNNYNKAYYSDANSKLNRIADAAIKARAKKIVDESEKKFNEKMVALNKLIIEINSNERLLEDYHNLLKLKITVPVIEQYQNKALPQTAPLEENNAEIKRIIESIKAITDN